MEDEGDIDPIVHDLFPGAEIFDVSGKAVDEEATSMQAGLLHCSLKEHDGDLTWYDLSLDDVLLDDLSVLRTWLFPFGTEKVTGREMDEFELLHDVLTLRTLSGARST